MTLTFTTDQYAARLEEIVRADLAAEPARYGGVATWVELHDVCDANEFILECDESFGYHFPSQLEAPEEWDTYVAVVNAAIAVVEKRVFLEAEVTE